MHHASFTFACIACMPLHECNTSTQASHLSCDCHLVIGPKNGASSQREQQQLVAVLWPTARGRTMSIPPGDVNAVISSVAASPSRQGIRSICIFFDTSTRERIDFFGFSLRPTQFLLVMATSLLMLGMAGTAWLLAFLFLYHHRGRCERSPNGSSNGISSGSSGWRRSTGSNIKGFSDLPKPPPSS